MSYLIVTADDLGYAPERDRGIFDAFEAGIVTTTSLLVNGPSALDAIAYYKQLNRDRAQQNKSLLSLGLHFNLTEGPCSRPIQNVEDSVEPGSNLFKGKFEFWEWAKQPSRAGELRRLAEAELRAQLEWFISHVGELPSHVDGHNHVHIIPQVARALATVLPECKVRWVRMPLEDMSSYEYKSVQQREFFQLIAEYCHEASQIFKAAGLSFSDVFIGLQLMGNENSAGKLCKSIRSAAELCSQKGGQVIEYMCHPGYPSTIGDDFSRSDERLHEMNVLMNVAVKHAISDKKLPPAQRVTLLRSFNGRNPRVEEKPDHGRKTLMISLLKGAVTIGALYVAVKYLFGKESSAKK